jgi:hypothetical protein
LWGCTPSQWCGCDKKTAQKRKEVQGKVQRACFQHILIVIMLVLGQPCGSAALALKADSAVVLADDATGIVVTPTNKRQASSTGSLGIQTHRRIM